ncbi:hypothetical protein, partial [Enterobacter roggenkampii]
IYTYELGVTSEVVKYERLYRKSYNFDDTEKKSRKVLVFERIGNEVIKRITEVASIDVISLKSNASLISSAYHYKFQEPLNILTDVFFFFYVFTSNVGYTGLNDISSSIESIHNVSEFYHKNDKAFNFVKDI